MRPTSLPVKGRTYKKKEQEEEVVVVAASLVKNR